MKNILASSLFFSLIFIVGCNKKNSIKNAATTIDVSKQWFYDPIGLLISSPGDDQWQMKTFTTEEMNLFTSLDTASFNGTATPTSSVNNTVLYPNPFTTVYAFSIKFSNTYSGPLILKSVIVDSNLVPYFKNATRITFLNGSSTIQVNPPLSVGKYRLYYTLSSQSNSNFFKSWGNIQRTQ